jgi:hypothetical protein
LLLRDGLIFCGALAGLGVPWLRWLQAWPPVERLALAAAAALVTGWLAGFGVYVAGLPLAWFWLAPALGAGLALLHPAAMRECLREASVRRAAAQWLLLAGWCLGWQATVLNYSGAAWQGDWYEHYDRAHFFLARWPRDFHFLDIYPLTARPPLVNLWSAVLMSAGGGAFHHHQVFMTLLSSLVFLPLAALVAAWQGGRRAQWLLLLVLMLNPLLVQNATFPWTKLAAAGFVVLAWLQLMPRRGPPLGGHLVFAGVALAGGMLAHYSTGTWIIALALAWLATFRREPVRPTAGQLARAVLAATVVFLPWVAWAIATYGASATFTQNTAMALAPQSGFAVRLANAGLNLFHTLSPVSLVGLDHPLLAHASPASRWRDGWFILYQLRLCWTWGIMGVIALLWLIRRAPPGPAARFAWVAVPVATVLGVITHVQPDRLGLAHISLQPLVLLGLAWLATRAHELPRWLRGLYAAGLAIDLAMGIGLHFALQSAWFGQAADAAALWQELPFAAQVNWLSKQKLALVFLGDLQPPAWGLVPVAATFVLAAWGWHRARAVPDKAA